MREDPGVRAVNLVHTAAWTFFAFCVVLIPFATWKHRVALASLLSGIVAIESLVLLFNAWRCPLTDVASRYTKDRRPNFDIYLPWLTEYNKQVLRIHATSALFWLAGGDQSQVELANEPYAPLDSYGLVSLAGLRVQLENGLPAPRTSRPRRQRRRILYRVS